MTAGRRAFVVVLDACGIGELPDAADYGDVGANTLVHVAEAAGGLNVPALQRLGLGSIMPMAGVAPADAPGVHGRLHALGPGKDTINGHWELMGVISERPLPTYPNGFPPEIVQELRARSGREVIANQPSDGIAALERWGAEHLRTGAIILYTSADSVLQLAAHDAVLPEPELHALCASMREVMIGEHAVGRVIARPFTGEPGAFKRTKGRKDFALDPPGRSYMDELASLDVPVHSVGKVWDVFAGRSIDTAHKAPDNATGLAALDELVDGGIERGLVFANLVDTDQIYGHRQDVEGFHNALREIDDHVGRWLERSTPSATCSC